MMRSARPPIGENTSRLFVRLPTIFAIASVLGATATAANARAYRTADDDPRLHTGMPVRHVLDTIPVQLSADVPVGVDIEQAELAISAATSAWVSDCSPQRFSHVAPESRAPNADDGVTTVVFVRDGWVSGGLAATRAAITDVHYVETQEGWSIVDADIYVNAETVDWASPGAPSIQAVLAHELGHVVGILHPCEHDPVDGEPTCAELAGPLPLMYPDYDPARVAPTADDVAALCAVYPVDPCGGVSCEAGQVCDAGACVGPFTCTADIQCPFGTCAAGGSAPGVCAPSGSEGTVCSGGNDCASRLCLRHGASGYCTHLCVADSECEGMQQCTEVEGRSVCAPAPTANCSVTGPGSGGESYWWQTTLLAGALVLGRFRRTRGLARVK